MSHIPLITLRLCLTDTHTAGKFLITFALDKTAERLLGHGHTL
jgi:hypothetical protein